MSVHIEENGALCEPGWFVVRGATRVYCRDWVTARITARAFGRLSDAEWQGVIDELMAEADAILGRAA